MAVMDSTESQKLTKYAMPLFLYVAKTLGYSSFKVISFLMIHGQKATMN
jgi:hypothetical protein